MIFSATCDRESTHPIGFGNGSRAHGAGYSSSPSCALRSTDTKIAIVKYPARANNAEHVDIDPRCSNQQQRIRHMIILQHWPVGRPTCRQGKSRHGLPKTVSRFVNSPATATERKTVLKNLFFFSALDAVGAPTRYCRPTCVFRKKSGLHIKTASAPSAVPSYIGQLIEPAYDVNLLSIFPAAMMSPPLQTALSCSSLRPHHR